MSFTTRKKPDGSLAIYVSSKNAIREPILDFIVEVYWPQGRLLREFTALLDPPDSFRQASADDEQLPKTDNYSPHEDQPNQRRPRQESENFRKRLTGLEQQMSAMQRLLALKDEQIAILQARQTPPAKEVQQPAHPAAIPPSTSSANIAPAPEVQQAKTQPAVQSREIPEASPDYSQTPAARSIPPSTPKPVGSPPPKPPPRMPGPPSIQTEPVISTAAANEEGFLAELLDHLYYLAGGATGVLLLTLLWQFIRRRSAMTEDPESILTLTDREKNTHQQKPAPEPVNVSQNVTEQPTVFRSSFLSEFTPSNFDTLSGDMTEVDPVSEADVYLAYGRYKQAEDLILGAIGQNPERDDCRLKLFEIHYAMENALAFEKCAQDLASTHKEAKPEFWEKVVEMGRELCPRNPLFNDNQQSTTYGTVH